MSQCRYKQIDVAILERVFAQIWYERNVGTWLAAIRSDRDLDVWEGVKDLLVAKRKREDGMYTRSLGRSSSSRHCLQPYGTPTGDIVWSSVRTSSNGGL